MGHKGECQTIRMPTQQKRASTTTAAPLLCSTCLLLPSIASPPTGAHKRNLLLLLLPLPACCVTRARGARSLARACDGFDAQGLELEGQFGGAHVLLLTQPAVASRRSGAADGAELGRAVNRGSAPDGALGRGTRGDG